MYYYQDASDGRGLPEDVPAENAQSNARTGDGRAIKATAWSKTKAGGGSDVHVLEQVGHFRVDATQTPPHLTFARAYIRKLLENANVVRFLKASQREIRRQDAIGLNWRAGVSLKGWAIRGSIGTAVIVIEPGGAIRIPAFGVQPTPGCATAPNAAKSTKNKRGGLGFKSMESLHQLLLAERPSIRAVCPAARTQNPGLCAGFAVQRERPGNKSGLFTHGTENAAPSKITTMTG